MPGAGERTDLPGFRLPITRDMSILLVCVCLSFLLWLLVALSKKYESELTLKVHYKNLPSGKVFLSSPPGYITIRVKTTGWDLLASTLRTGIGSISIDLSRYPNAKSFSTGLLQELVLEGFSQGAEVAEIRPKQIFIHQGERFLKKVPVVADVKLAFSRQFDLSGKVDITPDSITISGPQQMIDSLYSWPTERVNLENISSSLTKHIPLKGSRGTTLTFSDTEVKIFIPVEEFTEGAMEVNIREVNVPAGNSVRLIPSVARVSYQVPLSRYAEVKAAHFDVSADIFQALNAGSNTVDLKAARHPAFVRKISIEPDQAEFIIYK